MLFSQRFMERVLTRDEHSTFLSSRHFPLTETAATPPSSSRPFTVVLVFPEVAIWRN